uniref:Uncharacterized protein n=1 Tax=Ditylenchus dipsaci TaxID=166011 RepID=A0A915D150_9BILA
MKTRKSTSSEVATNFCDPTTSFSTKNHSAANGCCHCHLCGSLSFSNHKQFIGHLKSAHCSISESGSLVCRYGKNGVCPSLPLEIFENGEDYAEHVNRFHMNQNGFHGSPVRSHPDRMSTDANGFTVNSQLE